MARQKTLEAKFGSPEKPLTINGIEIPCYVLEDGKRVIVQSGIYKALGIQKGGTTSQKYKEFGGGARLVRFLDQNNLSSMITNDIRAVLVSPIIFNYNKTIHYGYEATLLQEIVKAISKAHLKGDLPKRYETIGINAEILYDAFAKVGIIALVDEATGFQAVREKDALKQFLEKFLQEEMAQWVKTFQDDFFESIFKMKGWTWHYASSKKPQVIGHYINDFVYARLGPEVLKELKLRNKNPETGKKKGANHQFLTPDMGHPALVERLNMLTMLAKATGYNWNNWKRMVERAFPRFDKTIPLQLPETED